MLNATLQLDSKLDRRLSAATGTTLRYPLVPSCELGEVTLDFLQKIAVARAVYTLAFFVSVSTHAAPLKDSVKMDRRTTACIYADGGTLTVRERPCPAEYSSPLVKHRAERAAQERETSLRRKHSFMSTGWEIDDFSDDRSITGIWGDTRELHMGISCNETTQSLFVFVGGDRFLNRIGETTRVQWRVDHGQVHDEQWRTEKTVAISVHGKSIIEEMNIGNEFKIRVYAWDGELVWSTTYEPDRIKNPRRVQPIIEPNDVTSACGVTWR